MKDRLITKKVWQLSLISLFTDFSSEMLYPIMPVFLKSIGFSIVLIGVLEGFAEAIAGLSKGYFGKLSDNLGKRVPFVQWGYAFSAVSKPMMAIMTYPWWIFLARTTDRLGKGIRTGARDALLADESTANNKGRIFGFHRSLDTIGAVLGPATALLFLHYLPGEYKTLFYLAFIPGLLAIVITRFLRESKSIESKADKKKTHFFSFLSYWRESNSMYRRLTIGLLAFALINSSDVFLLLKIKESGLSDTQVIGTYIFYNLVFVTFSYPLGILADKIGFKNMLIAGFTVFALVYWGAGYSTKPWQFLVIFILYGIYAAATEGISKAWISKLVPGGETATAIGSYTAFQSICTLLASIIAGLLWQNYGASATFYFSAVCAIMIVIYLSAFVNERVKAA